MSVVIRIEGRGDHFVPDGSQAVIGRDRSVDIRVDYSRVSRHHLRVIDEAGTWFIDDLQSSNGTFLDGKAIDRIALTDSIAVNLGAKEGPAVSFVVIGGHKQDPTPPPDVPEESGQPEKHAAGDVDDGLSDAATTHVITTLDEDDTNPDHTRLIGRDEFPTEQRGLTKRINLKPRTRIGREGDNDIAFDGDLMVSRYHAEIVSVEGGRYRVVDLKSANGTFVDGRPVKSALIDNGQLIAVGSHVMRFQSGALEPLDDQAGFNFDADKISLSIGGKRLLNDVSFSLKPSSLTAVVGPSGSGKSTLLSVLSGQRRPTSGSVQFAGRDLHQSYEELRTRIGMVPQADLLHTNLKTRRALEYGAALRLPKDTTKAERAAKVDQVMADLGLTQRAELQISRLSGGQKKRASVALELMTDPELLFLDEPTSGLDPGLDRQVMNMLRGLADHGHTVVIVTHSTANLDVCDDIVVMAAGGHLAYCGSPHGVMSALGGADWADVFDNLEKGVTAAPAAPSKTPARTNGAVKLEAKRRQSLVFQFLQLAQRYVEVIASDRAYLGLMFLLPVLVGSVALMTGGEFGIGPGDDDSFGLNIDARSSLLVIILGAVFMGASSAIQEIVKERVIYERERATGLSRVAYLASKFVVLAVITTFQSVVFVLIALGTRPLPEEGLWSDSALADIVIAVALLALAASALGLALSALASSTDVAMPALVVVTMVQVVFSGAVPLIAEWILDVFGPINPGYWAMNALASVSDLNELMGYSGDDVVKTWEASMENLTDGVALLGVFVAVFLVLAHIMLVVRERRG